MAKVLCIIQARMGSTRLPGKVLKKVKDKTLLEYEIDRVKKAGSIDKIVVATTTLPEDEAIEKLCQTIGLDCFRGSADDVLDRYAKCAAAYPDYDTIVRITGDCPLIDPQVIDKVITYFADNDLDYASNVEVETYPDGMDLEVMKKDVLLGSAAEANLASEREHVTLNIRQNQDYRKGNVASEADFSHFRLTIDNPEDFEVAEFLLANGDPNDSLLDIIALLTKNPEVMMKNMHIKRNEGLAKSLKNDHLMDK